MSEARGLEFPVGVVLLGNNKSIRSDRVRSPFRPKIFEALNRVDPSLGSLLLLAAAAAAAAYRLRTADFSFLLPGRAFLCKFSSEMKKREAHIRFWKLFLSTWNVSPSFECGGHFVQSHSWLEFIVQSPWEWRKTKPVMKLPLLSFMKCSEVIIARTKKQYRKKTLSARAHSLVLRR